MSGEWKERKRPVRLEKRYDFSDYSSLRDFLDASADVSEEMNLYPDLGFGKDYVNVTIHCEEGEETLRDAHREYAESLDGLYQQQLDQDD